MPKPKLPQIEGKELVRLLIKIGFEITRQKGSHVRMESKSGTKVSVPVHPNRNVPTGLLHDIITKDLGLTLEEFVKLLDEL
jgi:predicted RNA binding protein YcfA (HicA-like mRNA interferase family)